MTQSHYSLRWNNHQNHILAAFDALLQAETLVDVTLVCAETSVRAHKVVLSACSPFFQRIFSENPCKHPVIVLKDFTGWEVQSIVDFMYKGEISVVQEQLQNLIKAAESLQVRGLANQEPLDKENCNQGQERSRSPSPHFFDNTNRSVSPFLPIMSKFEPILKGGETRNERLGRGESQSPIPRRKQARPRRRSGECAPQDLSMNKSQSHSAPSPPLPIQMPPSTPLNPLTASSENMDEQEEEVAENLCIKKRDNDEKIEDSRRLDNKSPLSEDIPSPLPPPPPNAASNMMLMMMSPPEMDLSLPPPSNNNNNQPLSALSPINLNLQQSTTPTLQQQLSPQHGTAINLKQEMDSSHSPLPPFPPMPSVSALAMTPPHSKFFGLDSPLGLFPPMDGCRNPLFDLPDPRTTPPEPQLFVKKKMGRPKGQHSAPRGGPPRSWTNAELTEALQHVWNKKMTTSQASRIFGIPYNSLLMYVRGKYGKSLKLEQLRKDCISGPPLDLLTMGGSGNNNNNCKSASSNNSTASEEPLQPNRPPSNPEEPPHPPLFNPFAPNFYPDFAAAAAGGFPIPVSMIHLLPQSEKSHHQFLPPGLESGKNMSEDADKMQTDEEAAFHLHHQQLHSSHQQLLRPPSLPSSMGVEEQRREILQQNGQD